MRSEDRRTLLFAAGVCVVCSLLLSTAAATLRGRQERMAELARRLNVLRAFGAEVDDDRGRRLPWEDIGALFDARVEDFFVDAATGEPVEAAPGVDAAERVERGDWLPLYRWREDGVVTRVAFPVGGPGLWGPVRGYLAIENDGVTIAGITFYEHQETPGLGAEIETERFQERFRGRTIRADGALQRVVIVKGAVRDRYPDGNPHAVDGISGATRTGEAVTEFLNEDIARYDVFLRRLREP